VATYTWLNKQGIRSSDGLEVQFTGRSSLEVRLGRRRKVVEIGDLDHPGSIQVPSRTFECWDNSTVPNDHAEQERLHRAFEAAMEFMARNQPP
jgi:hypothetical protein